MVTSFTDWDSGLYLQHHGVKGMKWGVRRYRNEDGSYTKAGLKHNARRLRKAFESGKEKKLHKNEAYQRVIKNTAAERRMSKDALNKFQQLESDFYSNKRLVKKTQKKLAKREARQGYGDYDQILSGYRRGDLEQGRSYEEYLRKNKQANEAYKNASLSVRNANDVLRAKARSEVDSVLGKYGKKKINDMTSTLSPDYRTVASRLVSEAMTYDDDYYSKKNKKRWR